MSNSFINAEGKEKKKNSQPSTIKVKLHIPLIFKTGHTDQTNRGSAFRGGEKINEDDNTDCLAQELEGCTITYNDLDEKSGEYLIVEYRYVIDENSPQKMGMESKKIDSVVMGWCNNPNIEKVILCFFVPSISDTPIIPTLFFQSFPPRCILKDEQKGVLKKIDNNKSYIYYFGFDKIDLVDLGKKIYDKSDTSNKLSQQIIQLSALICQYTYFYVDYYESKDWTKKMESLTKEKSIRKYCSKVTGNTETKPISFWSKIGQTISTALSLPVVALQKTFDFLFNYDGHLENRIYGRIKEVSDITGKDLYETIYDILKACQANEDKQPIRLHDYYQMSNYWSYLKEGAKEEKKWEVLEEETKKWKVVKHEKGIISGFGALLFTDGKDYIYCMKGTDFDSYGRDWILTNLLQGLTGFSGQHIIAINEGKNLDSLSKDKNIWFIGHSLGGGLASAATIATKNRIGITFNAAGLNVIGVKINQLINNPASIMHPSQSWNRVFPYRIKGEILDQAQEKFLRPISIGTLERGYGKKSVEIELKKDGSEIPCGQRHGINNFLYKDVLNALQPFNEISKNASNQLNNGNNKVVKVEISGKYSKATSSL